MREHVHLKGLCEGRHCKPCILPATSHGDLISCSMYLGVLVRNPGSWEGGTGVCRSRGEQKAPAEESSSRDLPAAVQGVHVIQTLRATLHQESKQCRAMAEVPW